MAEKKNDRAKSALPFGIVVGGFVWLVFDSLFFGGLAGVLTFVLMKRDAREEDHDGEF